MSFFINDSKLFKSYCKMQNKVNDSIKKGCGSEPMYDTKYLKTKTKSHEGKINTNFHDNGIPKEGSHCI